MIDDDALNRCVAVLDAARELDPDDPRYLRLEQAAAHLRKTAKKRRRRARKQSKAADDRARLRATGLAEQRFGPAEAPPAQDELHRQRRCYVCKRPYRKPHDFYHLMCVACGDDSRARRDAPLDLGGRRALVTGGRVKIGYATALRLLRAGAEVHVTTRFAADARERYAAEPDAASWQDRLHVHRLDFRDLPGLLARVERWRTGGPAFDILINNAAQTVWHPPEHYRALRAKEAAGALDAGEDPSAALALLEVPVETVDMSRQNSWTQRLAEIAPVEMLEVQVVNVTAPFLLASRLKPNLAGSPFPDRYIVNVAALEGQFSRHEKSDRHPHTNMAKAALNMLTRTSAADYARDGIHMVSVDPGWMSNEGPPEQVRAAELRGFHPPLEAEDCAARIVDPIVRGRRGDFVQGILLKDFQEVPW